jgi:lysophospholipid acyltransferase (LPLAT)-like uncharacterized protein
MLLSMKIRHPVLIKAVGWVIAWVVRLWVGTVRYRCRRLGTGVEPTVPGLETRYIYAFWHETLLLPAYHYSRTATQVLISEHADGEMIARACQRLGLGVVRGSTSRGGIKAMRQIIEMKGRSHLVITPDGPRGPRREVQPGLVYLAARTGLPIVPVGFASRKAWRMRSWDRFAVPLPFTSAVGVLAEPIHVPADADKGQLEQYRLRVQQAMDDAMKVAEEMTR